MWPGDRYLHFSICAGLTVLVSSTAEIEITNLEKALSTADNKLIDLEATNKNLSDDRDRHMNKVEVETGL